MPGTSAWDLAKPASAGELEGYASKVSAAAGEVVELKVNVSSPQAVRWSLYRLGYYQGLGGRKITEGDAGVVSPQPQCPVSPTTGMVECSWRTTFSVTVQDDWLSGYYLFKLTRPDGLDAHIPLIVREAQPQASVLVQAPVATWQAYNSWGGTSLYINLLPQPRVREGQAVKVSFDRPYNELPIRDLERWLVFWLERNGYDVGYTTGIDLHARPEELADRHMLFAVGHDEYWTNEQRKALDGARDAGLAMAFLSGNTGFWRIRLEPSASGEPFRTVVGYKTSPADPRTGQPDACVRFRDNPYAAPENALLGSMYETWGTYTYSGLTFPLLVSNPTHWIFEGTGMQAGDGLGNLVGNEWDRVIDNGLTPKGLEILGESPAISKDGSTSLAHMTLYCGAKGNVVFNAGTIDFAWALGKRGYAEPRAQRVIANLLSYAGVEPNGPLRLDPPRVTPTDPPMGGAGKLIAGSARAGYEDGPAARALFNQPAALAVDPDGTIYVADSNNHSIRMITVNGSVSTLAGGAGKRSSAAFADGVKRDARFWRPLGLAVGPDRALYVADSGNHRIRRVLRDGTVTTFAGQGSAALEDGPVKSAKFSSPTAVAFDANGAVYVADTGNDAVRKIVDGNVTTLATEMGSPTGLVVGPDGTVYVVSTGVARIVSISPAGVVSILTNEYRTFGSESGPAARAQLRPMSGIVYLGDDRLVFSDTGNGLLRELDLHARLVMRFAGSGRASLHLGESAGSSLSLPRGLAVWDGSILVADGANHRIVSFSSVRE